MDHFQHWIASKKKKWNSRSGKNGEERRVSDQTHVAHCAKEKGEKNQLFRRSENHQPHVFPISQWKWQSYSRLSIARGLFILFSYALAMKNATIAKRIWPFHVGENKGNSHVHLLTTSRTSFLSFSLSNRAIRTRLRVCLVLKVTTGDCLVTDKWGDIE